MSTYIKSLNCLRVLQTGRKKSWPRQYLNVKKNPIWKFEIKTADGRFIGQIK